jgi:hypothetical protein
MKINLDWNILSIDEWEEKFSRIPHSNILQSYSYARAAAPLLQQKPRWALIVIDGREAGLVQIFEAGILWNAIHAVMVDRGPLWFEGFGTALHVKLFFDEINRLFPKRFGRRRRFLPETEDGPTAQKLIAQTGLERIAPGYETIWLDLKPSEEDLRANLKQKWRNGLNKAERANMSVSWECDADIIEWARGIYAADKAVRDYSGISPKLFSAYAKETAQKGDLILVRAMLNEEPIAFTACVAHGRSATYVVGWSSEAGRDAGAHTLLLWETLLRLKNNGIIEFDLGGISNDEQAAGIKTFKEGLGGRIVRYVGHYR